MHPDTCFKESCESTRARAPDRCVPGGAELCPRWSLRNGARVALLTGAGGCHRPWLGPAAKMYSPAMCTAAQRWAPWAWGVLVGHRAGAVGAYMVGGGWEDHRVALEEVRGGC